jgi:hypothetical protein
MSSEIESFTQKIARHLHDGEFNPGTIIGGAADMLNRMASLYESDARIATINSIPGLCRNPGLDLAIYNLQVPNFAFFPDHMLRIFAVKFPRARFAAFNTSSGQTVSTSNLLNLFPQAVATFTGPTFKDGVPNNGFFSAESGLLQPFGAPEVGRRGAFAITKQGEISTLTDDDRRNILSDSDDAIDCVVGTSNYILNSDAPALFPRSAEKSSLSYLAEFGNGSAPKDFVFFVTNNLFTRGTLKMVMDTYLAAENYTDYKAVELEYTHSACFVRNDAAQMRLGGRGFATRKDHYLVIPNR